jgi:polyisoprenyl-phosphate glycosyltransferase
MSERVRPAPTAPTDPRADCFISVIAPLSDDADIVEEYVTDVVETLRGRYAHFELVLVDDGSTDETVAVVTGLLDRFDAIRLICLSRSFGQEAAISAGLDSAIGDFVVVMLPDSDPPALVPQMIESARDGAGIVYGIRRTRRGEPLFLRLGAQAFYWYANRVLRLRTPKNATHFRVLSRQVVNALIQIKDQARYLRTLSGYVGYASRSVEYDPIRRRRATRRKSLFQAFQLAVDIIVTNSAQPLRHVTLLGVAVSGLNAMYVGYIVAIYMFKDEVAEGWVTQSLQTAVMFFFLFLLLTVLSEYVGRILDQVKDRPLYYVLEEHQGQAVTKIEERKNVVSKSVAR